MITRLVIVCKRIACIAHSDLSFSIMLKISRQIMFGRHTFRQPSCCYPSRQAVNCFSSPSAPCHKGVNLTTGIDLSAPSNKNGRRKSYGKFWEVEAVTSSPAIVDFPCLDRQVVGDPGSFHSRDFLCVDIWSPFLFRD